MWPHSLPLPLESLPALEPGWGVELVVAPYLVVQLARSQLRSLLVAASQDSSGSEAVAEVVEPLEGFGLDGDVERP